ncbi:unannotated protein [freshwater metagenome]|uniref:Unannotated protein n=1 Tax=freshwater metagenome TaxID=449393 RepID=A0A6J7FR84_9ZZZZ|nr:hypothetical protein [Actinomycetota bacterium]
MKRVFVPLVVLVGLAAAPVAQAAGPSAKGADREAAAAAVRQTGVDRRAAAVCNPERSRKTNDQLRTRWYCEVKLAATPDDVATFGDGVVPADPLPLATTVSVAWADGEYEATAIGKYGWAPLPAVAPKLGVITARSLVWTALRAQGFSSRSVMDGESLKCSRRASSSFRCRVSWFVGDSATQGTVTVSSPGPVDDGQWTYSWTLRLLDTYCRDVLKRSLARCSTIDRVR